MACDRATSRKYMLKKKENSLYKVTGRKVNAVYLALETVFGGKRVVCAEPMTTSRDEEGSSSSCSSSSCSSPLAPASGRHEARQPQSARQAVQALLGEGAPPPSRTAGEQRRVVASVAIGVAGGLPFLIFQQPLGVLLVAVAAVAKLAVPLGSFSPPFSAHPCEGCAGLCAAPSARPASRVRPRSPDLWGCVVVSGSSSARSTSRSASESESSTGESGGLAGWYAGEGGIERSGRGACRGRGCRGRGDGVLDALLGLRRLGSYHLGRVSWLRHPLSVPQHLRKLPRS